MVSVFDSVLLADSWSSKQMREIFSDENRVQKWLDFWAALASEQANLGIIPKEAAEEISKKAKYKNLDMNYILEELKKTKHPLVPTIRGLEKICENGYGEYVHFGVTTQDAIDSGLMIQLKEATNLIKEELKSIAKALYKLSNEHKNTPMMGRTLALQALPITFGHKTAIWLSEVLRHLERIDEMSGRVFVGSIVGAVGTKASLSDFADEVEYKVCKRLGLLTPNISWQPSRDRLYEFGSVMGGINATFNKISHELLLLAHNEFNEVAEPFGKGQVGSSTMPHKRNPAVSENALTVSNTLKANIMILNELTKHEHERDGSVWKMEFKVMPEICLMLSVVLENMKFVLSGLEVKKAQMIKNLDILQGYVLAERVMFALADKLGKQHSHEIVYELSMQGIEKGVHFKDMLKNDKVVMEILTQSQIDELLDATTYVGYAPKLVEKLLKNVDNSGILS